MLGWRDVCIILLVHGLRWVNSDTAELVDNVSAPNVFELYTASLAMIYTSGIRVLS